MSFRNILVCFLILLTALLSGTTLYAQKKDKGKTVNPVLEARQRAIDSAREAQVHYYDSLRAARQAYTDSLKEVRQHRTDSLAAIRKYRSSKHYKDSVTAVRQARVDSIRAVRTAYFDSIRAARKHVIDSTIAARRKVVDSIRAIQKHRADSLAVIRKYRSSKRYKDSVAVVRKERLDSIKAVRQAFNDSLAAARKAYNDSLAAERKAKLDSMMAVRKAFVDSLKEVRKARTDSLAKIKEKREKAQKDRLKNREEKMKLALEMKIKKKREAWSNEKMLKKRWSPPRKAIQNTFTRYNYYYNSELKMEEAMENMRRVSKDNYDSMLALFPFDPDRDSALIAPDMDSIIQKTSIGVQLHDPRTKWGDDLYLLMGQAYYYKGDYDNASTTFKYIVGMYDRAKKKASRSRRSYSSSRDRNKKTSSSVMEADKNSFFDFLKHRSVHNESLLWLARTFTEWHKEGEAESVLDLLETDPNLPENMRGRLALEKAYVNLSQNDLKAATENLQVVAADKEQPGWIRQRAAFINGQILYNRGDYNGSASSYAQVIDLHPQIDMDFYARKNMAYSLMMGGQDQDEAVASLRRILKDGKYVPYYEQVYYVIGKLSANTGKTDEAISYLNKSIHAPRATKRQKALSFAALGNVYYGLHQYDLAKLSYDSAAMLATAVPDDTSVNLAVRRAVVLDYVTRPAGVIHAQDSLLNLAAMSDREQRSEVRKYIRYLRDKRADSIFAAQNAGLNNAMQNAANNNLNNTGGGANYANWYFSNPVQMQQGQNEFKRKWGNRPLADNWRRASALSGSGSTGQQVAGAGDTEEDNPDLDENGLPTEESLIAYIPNAPERKEQALKDIRRAYVDLSDAYIQRLEDYPEAIRTLDTLDKRFPAHEFKDEELYQRYLVALRQNDLQQSRIYANMLIDQYPDSKCTKLVRPTEDGAGLANNNSIPVAEYHDSTYSLLLQRRYNESLDRARQGEKMYTDEGYYKKFRIIEAISLLGVEQLDEADSIAFGFIKKYPGDSLLPWAQMVLDYTKKYRAAHPELMAAANKPGTANGGLPAGAAGTNAPAPSDGNAPAGAVKPGAPAAGNVPPPPEDSAMPLVNVPPPKEYAYNPQEPHYVVFSFPVMEQRAMGVKAALGDFNTFKFANLGLNVGSEMLTAQQGLVAVRTFDNAARAKIYLNELKNTSQIFREYKTGEYQLFLISASNYAKLVNDKGIAEYFNFYRSHYK